MGPGPGVHEVAFTLTPTVPPSPIRKMFPPAVRDENVMVACVESVRFTLTLAYGPLKLLIAILPKLRVKLITSAFVGWATRASRLVMTGAKNKYFGSKFIV